MKADYIGFGKRLKETRERRKLTQEKLAELIGKTNNFISNIECAKSKPSIDTLVEICAILEVTPDYLLLNSIYEYSPLSFLEVDEKLKRCNKGILELLRHFLIIWDRMLSWFTVWYILERLRKLQKQENI